LVGVRVPRTPNPGGLVPAGVGAWLCTVVFGMVLRVVSGQGTAVSFIIVALAFLGLFLLGWRLLWRFFARRASAQPATGAQSSDGA
jgi:hypothetical protein